MMKKLASLIMALAMALTLAVPAMAVDTGSITLNGSDTVPVSGKTFAAYKILDLEMVGTTGYVYTVPEEMESFYNDRYDLAGTEANYDYLVYEKIAAETDMFAFAAAALEAAKDAGVAPAEGTAGKDDTSVTIGGLPLGYYVIEDEGTATPISALMLDSTNPNININIKADKPTLDKTDDDADGSVEVGQIVNFTVTTKVPDTTGYSVYTFQLSDTMTDGLTFVQNVVVKVDGITLTQHCTIVYSDDGFDLDIDVMKLQEQKGKAITLEYKAVVNENAVAEVEDNHITLTYSNNPNDSESTDTIEDEEEVYSAKIIIDKYDAGDADVKLSGAQFVLKNEAGKYYKFVAATAETQADVMWVDSQDEADKVTTNANGAAEFAGLENGTYFLEEIVAPTGYNLLQGTKEVVIAGSDAETATLTVEVDVPNNSGNELPGTGGMGTTLFYALGAVLVIGAGVAMVTKKRMA